MTSQREVTEWWELDRAYTLSKWLQWFKWVNRQNHSDHWICPWMSMESFMVLDHSEWSMVMSMNGLTINQNHWNCPWPAAQRNVQEIPIWDSTKGLDIFACKVSLNFPDGKFSIWGISWEYVEICWKMILEGPRTFFVMATTCFASCSLPTKWH